MGFLIERCEWVPVEEVGPGDVMGIAEAAQALGVTINSVNGLMRRGVLSTIVDEAPRPSLRRSGRLCLRSEVEALAREREGAK